MALEFYLKEITKRETFLTNHYQKFLLSEKFLRFYTSNLNNPHAYSSKATVWMRPWQFMRPCLRHMLSVVFELLRFVNNLRDRQEFNNRVFTFLQHTKALTKTHVMQIKQSAVHRLDNLTNSKKLIREESITLCFIPVPQ